VSLVSSLGLNATCFAGPPGAAFALLLEVNDTMAVLSFAFSQVGRHRFNVVSEPRRPFLSAFTYFLNYRVFVHTQPLHRLTMSTFTPDIGNPAVAKHYLMP
jgi:hypothetical protein